MLHQPIGLSLVNIRNCRPVSLVSFFSKTLEHAVFNQLSPHHSQNDLLDPNQSGFIHSLHKDGPPHSDWIPPCLQSLFPLIRPHSLLIFCVWHSQPTNSPLHLASLTLLLPGSYLTNHTFQVIWNGSLSKRCFLETSVPQVSVLLPLLFSIYTRSLGSAIISHGLSYHCYADYIQLFLSFPLSSDTRVATCISECLADNCVSPQA